MTYSEKWCGGRELFIKDGGKIWEWPLVDEIVRVEYMKRYAEDQLDQQEQEVNRRYGSQWREDIRRAIIEGKKR